MAYFTVVCPLKTGFAVLQAKAVGRVLFDQVCKQLHLLEADYFGLEYLDSTKTRVAIHSYKLMCLMEQYGF